jgi:hypothetical protein
MGTVVDIRKQYHATVKAALPDGYIAIKVAAGRKWASRYSIYHGGAHTMSNWIGDIVYFEQENVWDSQPRDRQPTEHKYAIDAINNLINDPVTQTIQELAAKHEPPF